MLDVLDQPVQLRVDWWIRQQETAAAAPRTVRDEREHLLGQLAAKRSELEVVGYRAAVLEHECGEVREQLRALADRDESEVL